VGAGGYGKTTLANALCRDEDVCFDFDDGILRVEVGKERDDVTSLVIDLIEQQTGKRPGFQNVQTAPERLAEVINDARLLLVIDDVWQEAQLRPFLRGGPNCVRLVTTRVRQALQERPYTRIDIDEMRTAEAVSLLSTGLTGAEVGTVQYRLSSLAKRLGHWAQLLDITNGWLSGWISDGGRLGDAIVEFAKRLDDGGLTALDAPDERQRNRAIRLCVEASLQDEKPSDLARFGELAVLPANDATPLSAVEALWSETGGLKRTNSVDLVRRLHSRSLVRHLNLEEGAQEVRLHDNMIWYLRDRIGADGCCAAHSAMVRAIKGDCGATWNTLPADHEYGWRHLIRHLRGAGRDEEADRLLTDYAWIKAKLRASEARGLFDSYLPEGQDEGVGLVGRAIALSLPALAGRPQELPRQLFGRLGDFDHQTVAGLVASARQDPDFRPGPRWPGLTRPGAERLRLVGHGGPVLSASFSPDGSRIVTALSDCTARLWDATTGQELMALNGHEKGVESASFSPDGSRIVTASSDSTARAWDATTRQEIIALRGHKDTVWSASFSPDGLHIVTASADHTARLWDATTGHEIMALRGHERPVSSASFSPQRDTHRHHLLGLHGAALGRDDRRGDHGAARP
jgi:NB-ARC domain/WD domain, G-beta repeat/APAF-1 helical domain